MTVSAATAELVASLARRWMPGTRHGGDRPAWRHPEDVVAVVRAVPGLEATDATAPALEAVAWGHDLLEDGVTESGARVTGEVLRAEGVPEEVIGWIRLLSKDDATKGPAYVEQVRTGPDVVRIVKCADRIANLTEARGTFEPARWAKYVAETEDWILPMGRELGGAHGAWLAGRLDQLVREGQTRRG